MRIHATTLQTAAIAATLLSPGTARADNSPLGLWIDHTGRGGVEIKECNGNKLCGHIVWLKDSKNMEACGEQVIGDAKPVGGGKWDNGWIYDPDAESKYDVELTPMGDKLKVVGYAGSKWLSETMTWKRAPADLPRCSKDKAAAAPATTGSKTATATPPVQPQAENKAEAKADAKADNKVETKQAELTPAPDATKPAPAPEDKAKAESKPETTDTAKADPEPEAQPNGDSAKPQTENNDSANSDDDDDKEDAPKTGKAMKKIAEALNFKKLKNGKCNMDVPFVDMKVTFDCDQ